MLGGAEAGSFDPNQALRQRRPAALLCVGLTRREERME